MEKKVTINIGKPASGELEKGVETQPSVDCNPMPEWGTPDKQSANRVLALVNDHRTRLALATVSAQTALDSAAQWKAMHMAGYKYLDHDDPPPPISRSVTERLRACGYDTGPWGENIANGYATPEEVMQGWLASAGHRANIENPDYTRLGVGCATSADVTV